jgi:hypothetical protein
VHLDGGQEHPQSTAGPLMSWSRFDDAWVERQVFEELDLAARWHYLCLIQNCSRNDRFDGVMPYSAARRVSDVPNPDECITALETVSLVEVLDEATRVRVTQIDEHIPPPSVRNNAANSRVRVSRMRRHKNGDHSECLPDHCTEAGSTPVTGGVTRNTGTGQDGLQTKPLVKEPEPVTRNSSNDKTRPGPSECPHGMPNGNLPDPWLKGRLTCPECAALVKAAS